VVAMLQAAHGGNAARDAVIANAATTAVHATGITP
jgi:hypothetical protein